VYLMYVDESGDCGLPSPAGGSPTRFSCLTGLVVHELRWRDTLNELIEFRHFVKRRYGVYLDEELHAAEMINNVRRLDGRLRGIPKHQRLAIVRHHADQLNRLSAVRLINVYVDKVTGRFQNPDDVFRRAWYALFQRFENTILHRNFPGPPNAQERGLVFPDATDAAKLKRHLGDMRRSNPLWTTHRDGVRTVANEPIRLLIEDPICRDSRDSYFLQAADCAVFLFKQRLEPSAYMRRHGGHAYFHTRLNSVLCTEASRSNEYGIVEL